MRYPYLGHETELRPAPWRLDDRILLFGLMPRAIRTTRRRGMRCGGQQRANRQMPATAAPRARLRQIVGRTPSDYDKFYPKARPM